MKTILALIICMLTTVPLAALSLYAGLDAASLLSFAYDELSIRAEVSISLDDNLRLAMGGGVHDTMDSYDDKGYGTVALAADYFPFTFLGLYVGMSLAEVHFPYGLDSDGVIRFSNTLRIGWSLDFPYVSLDLRLNIRDLVSAGAQDSHVLAQTIGQLGRFSFTCLVSYRYDFNMLERRLLE